jgi:hypothetical protein
MLSAKRFRINRPKVIDEAFDDEVVIINFDTGSYYSLNGAGADIWGIIGASAALGEIVEAIAGRYEGSRPEIEDGVHRLIAELELENLIVADGERELGDRPEGRAHAAPPSEKSAFQPPHLEKFTDMQELILLDPIHQVDETGWPNTKPPSPKDDD